MSSSLSENLSPERDAQTQVSQPSISRLGDMHSPERDNMSPKNLGLRLSEWLE